MRVLIEEYKYQAADVKDILHGINALENIEGYVSLNYVGYFYNTELRDCVFILPKVLLETIDKKDLVFGKYPPEEILNIDTNKAVTQTEKNFIYEFAVWIYRAIVVFQNSHKDSIFVYHSRKEKSSLRDVRPVRTKAPLRRNYSQWGKLCSDRKNACFLSRVSPEAQRYDAKKSGKRNHPAGTYSRPPQNETKN